MKLKFSLLAIALLYQSGCLLFAQDSLEKKIDSLLNQCRRLSSKPDSLEYMGTNLLELGKEQGSIRSYFEGYFAVGLAKARKGNIKEAAMYYDSSLQFTAKDVATFYNAHTRILRNKGIVLTRLGKYTLARKDFQDLLELGMKNSRPREIAFAYNQLGLVEKSTNNLKKAVDYYLPALAIADSMNLASLKYSILTNLGIAQSGLGQRRESLKYRRLALEAALESKRPIRISSAYNNIATEYRELGIYDSAMFLFKKNLIFQSGNDLRMDVLRTLQNIGNTYLLMEEYDSAESYLKKVHQQSLAISDFERQIQSVRLLGQLFFAKEQYDSALLHYDSALNIIIRNSTYAELQKTYKGLADIYEAKQDFESANKFLRQEAAVKDSLYSVESLKTLNEVLAKYDVSEKEAEIQRLSIYQKLLTPVSIGSFALLIAILIVLYLWKRSKKDLQAIEEQNEDYRSEIERNKNEIIELKSRAILNVDDIVSIKADGHYLEFNLTSKEKPEIDRNGIKSILNNLPTKFIQIHRSYIVNVEYIKIKYSDKVVLNDGTELPVSRTYKKILDSLSRND